MALSVKNGMKRVVNPKALLFDIGGVVIDIDFAKVFRTWADFAGCDIAHIKDRFQMDDLYKSHETGHISGAEYFAGLRQSLEIELTDQQFLEGWNALQIGEVPGIRDVLKAASQRYPLYAFSNTNDLHKDYMMAHYAEVLDPFDTVFISSTLGVRKPDPIAFERVVAEIGVPASEILFFDDTQENIDGARACSFQTVKVSSIRDVIDAGIT